MKKLPEFLREYFWDVELDKINFKNRKVYILKRILEYGNEKAIAWMWGNFKKSEIKDTLSHFRGYSLKTANLDFFTKEEFDENALLPEIKEISFFQLEKIAA